MSKVQLIKFYKPNCAPCYNMNRVISSIDSDRLSIVELNVEESDNLKKFKEYGFTGVPAFVNLDNEEKLEGSVARDRFLEFIGGV